MIRRVNQELAASITATARKYLGYTAEALGRTSFGERVGYQSQPWAGAFIDVVLRESGLRGVPSFVYTPAALAEFLRNGAISNKPRPGDIAIFNFSSNNGHAASAFSQPHAGIVNDVRHLSTNGTFTTIEGNINGPNSYQDKDGVHQQIRHLTDVILFLRPVEFSGTGMHQKVIQLLIKLIKKLTGSGPDKLELEELNNAARDPKLVELSKLRAGTRNKQIELVQLALGMVTDLNGCEPGKWDFVTASAFARYQRNIGRVGQDASGLPEVHTLKRLAADSGIFRIDE
jgi:hypothetical protein